MTTDRDHLVELVDAIESDRADRGNPVVRVAAARARAHLQQTHPHDCAAETERASRAAYAAGAASVASRP